MIKLSFIKESLLYTIGNALPMAASVILLPFYANYLNTTNYVALSFYIGISLLYQVLFSFSFEQYYGVVYTELKHDAIKVRILNGSIFLYLLIQAGIIIFVSTLLGNALLKIIFDQTIPVYFFPYGLLSVFTGLFNALFKLSMGPFIYEQKPKLFFFSNLTNFLATVSISLTGLFLSPNSLNGPIYGRFLSGLIILLFNYILLKDKFIWKIEWTYIKEFITKSWALFAYALILWISGNIDRYFLKNYTSVDDLAGYDLMMKCFIGIEFIQNGLAIAIIAKVFDLWKKEKTICFHTEVNRYFNTFILTTILATLMFSALLPYFIEWIIREQQYYKGFQWIILIAISFIIRSISYPYYFALLYAKKTRHLFAINGILIILQILASYLFIPQQGLIAALYISMIHKILLVLAYHFSIRPNADTQKINMFKWFFLPLFISAVSIFLYHHNSSFFTFNHFIILFIFLITALIIYRNELKKLYTQIQIYLLNLK